MNLRWVSIVFFVLFIGMFLHIGQTETTSSTIEALENKTAWSRAECRVTLGSGAVETYKGLCSDLQINGTWEYEVRPNSTLANWVLMIVALTTAVVIFVANPKIKNPGFGFCGHPVTRKEMPKYEIVARGIEVDEWRLYASTVCRMCGKKMREKQTVDYVFKGACLQPRLHLEKGENPNGEMFMQIAAAGKK